MESPRISQPHQPPGQPLGTADLVERLSRFDGPPEQFLLNLLAVQCHIAGAEAGAILRPDRDGKPEILAVYPQLPAGSTPPVWLAESAERAGEVVSAGETAIRGLHSTDSLYGQPADRHLVMIPLRSGRGVRGLAAFLVATADAGALAASRERLELTVSLLSLYEMRLTLQRRQFDLQRLRTAMEILAGTNERRRFAAAAMGLCNELASRWNCDRTALGILKGRYVHLKGLSHTEKFSRKMQLAQSIEAAMEECLDQDIEIMHPHDPEATYVSRAAADLSKRHGPTCVLSLPLRREGEVVGVVTVERPPDRPFTLDEIEALRLTCDLSGPRIIDLHNADRWFGARLAEAARKGLGAVLGPRHTWAKIAAIGVCAFLIFALLAKGAFRADGAFVLQAMQRRLVSAPFDGYLNEVHAAPGDVVQVGQVLATLDTSELSLQLAAAKAERIGYLTQADAALSDAAYRRDPQKMAENKIALASAKSVAAQIELLDHRIRLAKLRSPVAGRVLVGDLERMIGSPVAKGDMLFEVAPIESLRAELSIAEDKIAEVQVSQRGKLATASYPDRRIEFVVERINPVAEVVDQRNIFKVRARLIETPPWMRPGLEGVAKIDIDRRSYAWLWTHRVVDWVRMKLWL